MSARSNRVRVLVVDDKLEFADTIADGLCDAGYDAQALGSGRAALAKLRGGDCEALITDLRMPDMDGLELVAASRALSKDRPVIVMTAYAAVDSAVESIRRGAYHYLTKPFTREELLIFLERALDEVRVRKEAAALRTTLHERGLEAGIIGKSKAIREALEIVARVSKTEVPVLITGETGTGKGLWARAIHQESPRANRPFVSVNCAALPETLLESELFGHVKGAFTGATENALGLFAEADGGTLFLDEIGEMTPGLQAKLLHVLEEGAVRPVGSPKERKVDVRLITATHRDLRELVRTSRFREDLLYRLDVVSIDLPALRYRREDLPDLFDLFLRQAKAKYPDSPLERIAPDALSRMMDHAWPGNVRELSHVVERLVVLGKNAVATAEDLPSSLGGASANASLFHGEIIPVRELQRRYAGWVLEQMGGHRGHTADKLGVDAKTLSKWLSRDPELAEAPSAEGSHA
jgi:two-component system response regulator HydG